MSTNIMTTFGETDTMEVGRIVYYRRLMRANSQVGTRGRSSSRLDSSQSEGSWRRGLVIEVLGGGRMCCLRDKITGEIIENVPVHPLRLLPDSITACKGIPDMVELDVLHEAAMMENIEIRYDKSLIYTRVGPILISVNPYEMIPNNYTEARRKLYRTHKDTSPHLYGLADEVYTSVMEGNNQSILITGESGAGKTEATKIIIQYMLEKGAHHAHKVSKIESHDMTETIRKRIMESNPILEAFGNAKTIRNDNSSRFGKFFELYCDESGNIAGANITRYLLEKSRVVYQAKGERNYHVFYQLCASKKYANILHDKGPQDFHYLNQSGCYTVQEIDEESSFEHLEEALLLMGVSPEDCQNLFKILAAILHLGNIDFRNNVSDYADLLNEESLIASAELLDVSPAKLRSSLLQRTMRVGRESRNGSVFKVPHNVTEALDSRDAIAKELYANVFDLLFKWINKAIDVSSEKQRWIGVLDIFGFEDMNVNSFEQLCINFANEKLHQFFVTHFFELEKKMYQEEGITTDHIVYVDNHACVEMIEARRTGLLSILDEDSRLKTSTDKSFVEKAKLMLKSSDYFDVNKFDPKLFNITHYAGIINYDATDFLVKNRDTLSADLESTILSTSNPILKLSSSLEHDGYVAVSTTGNKNTVGSRFRAQLFSLMAKLGESTPHYVRCIKPNSTKTVKKFNVSMVLQQLRYSGVLESIHIRKAGYISRFDKKDFVERFHVLCSNIQLDRINDRCKEIIKRVEDISWNDVKIGKSKIFFRKNYLPQIQKEVGRFLHRHVVMIQKIYRGYRVRRETIIKKRAIRLIQAHGRRWRPYKRFQKVKKAILLVQKVWRGYRVRKMVKILRDEIRAEQKRRQMATLNESLAMMEVAVGRLAEREAIKIQQAWRMYKKKVRHREVVQAATIIQTQWRKVQLRRSISSILDTVISDAERIGAEYDTRLQKSARIIQNYVRKYRQWKAEKNAAILIQNKVRIFLARRAIEREELKIKMQIERERKIKELEEELFGKAFKAHGISDKTRSISGPLMNGCVAIKVTTIDSSYIIEDAYAILMPGRIVFYEDKSCVKEVAAFAFDNRFHACMDEGALKSENYHFKIKLQNTNSKDRRACVFATKSISDQTRWFKQILEELSMSEESSNYDYTFAQGWLMTQHNSRVFAVRFEGGIVGFQTSVCRDIAVIIPIVNGETTTTVVESSNWFAINRGEVSDLFRADTIKEAEAWKNSMPSSPTINKLKNVGEILLEGFLGVYEQNGYATTFAKSGSLVGKWIRLYAVISYSHILFFSDTTCLKSRGKLPLSSLYVHPTDKFNLVRSPDEDIEYYGFRLNRPEANQIMVSASTPEEAYAWIQTINYLGSESKDYVNLNENSKLNVISDGERFSDDFAATRNPTTSLPRHTTETQSKSREAKSDNDSPQSRGHWGNNLQKKLLKSPYWSHGPELMDITLQGLKQEVALERMLRRT